MRRAACLPALAIVALAGCGGGGDDAATDQAAAKAQITRAFDAYRASFVKADFAGACRVLAPSEARKTQALVKRLGIGGEGSCTSALHTLSDLARAQGDGPKILNTLRHSRVVAVNADGDRATFRYRTPKGVTKAGAQRVDGRWLVTGVTGT